ncbi:hypothetical protein QNH10_01815 [Sporosarcina thermotolerans]|uniref:hypothetical protein n=1 Tax=Sporosarcina thermotolerans TaxID=633404 RepID=UPI0024BC2586|nr:hypothetical protein [Sporosarcina thermotolerans]WHT48596.1 hypothetical protein QNH10_01815 [Sporosarcina thermotolerans]
MDIRTERIDAFKVVGMTLSVLLREERKKKLITTLHDDFNKRVHEVKNRVNPSIGYGIFIDHPITIQKPIPLHGLREWR